MAAVRRVPLPFAGLFVLLIGSHLPADAAQATGNAATPPALPVGMAPTRAQAADGQYIAWREHLIDERTAIGEPLTGGDGFVQCDLDLDGDVDIVSVHESDTSYDGRPDGHVRAAFGAKDPQRWQNVTLLDGVDAGAPEDAACGDLDSDGYPDVIVAAELAHLVLLRNPGRNARRAQWPSVILPITRNRGSFIRVFLADFDGDGRLDVSTANKGAQSPDPATSTLTPVSILRADGDPMQGASWREHQLGRYRIPQNAQPVDVDGDGDMDVVAGVRGERRLVLFVNARRQKGELRFREQAVRITGGVEAAGFNLAFADFDADGRLDIISAANVGLVWLRQPADLTSAWDAHVIGTFNPDTITGFGLADIDGDGDIDVMAGSYSSGPRDADGNVGRDKPLGRIGWFANGGDATTWTRHDVSRRQRGMFDKFEARDLDADGHVDFIGTRGNSQPYDGVFWLQQTRSAQPAEAFTRARAQDSAEVPLPAASKQATR